MLRVCSLRDFRTATKEQSPRLDWEDTRLKKMDSSEKFMGEFGLG